MKKQTGAGLRRRLAGRFRNYWRIEAANVLLLPLTSLVVAHTRNEPLGPATIVAFLPAAFLLVIGAAYWRAKYLQIDRGRSPARVVRLIAGVQPFALVLTIGGLASVAAVWLTDRWAVSTLDAVIASGAAALGLLEYLNYYHVQLQHFDHAPDWLRLVRGRGFRRSHMRRDIDVQTADRSRRFGLPSFD